MSTTQVFEAKSERELQQLDVSELVTYLASYTAAMDEDKKDAKKAMDEKEEEAKKAMDMKDDETKKAKKAMDDHKEKVEAAVMKAMDEPDKEKRADLVKSAMDMKEDEKEAKHTAEDDEEKKALKAQVTYLANKQKQPIINYLKQIYTAAKVDESTLKTYEAEWESMTSQQLDGAVQKVKPLVESMGVTSFEAEIEKSPFGFSSLPAPLAQESSFSANREFAKIDKMTPEEAFGSGGPYA